MRSARLYYARLKMGEESIAKFGSAEFIFNACAALGCVTLASLAAGLTMGLIGIDPMRLQILMESEEAHCTSVRQRKELREEKSCAKSILPVVTRHHLLLVTLLLLNSIANECLPLFLDEIVPSWLAIILSVTLVLLCGEIIPSAIFTGPNQLYVAARFVPVVKFTMFIMWPIAYPISRILDYCLGEEQDDKFNKAELRALVKLHGQTSHRRSSSAAKASDTGSNHGGRRMTARVSSAEIKSKLTEIGVDERTASMAAMATAAAAEAIEEEENDFWGSETHGLNTTLGAVAGNNTVSPDLENSPGLASRHDLSRAGSMATTRTDNGLELDEILIMNGALDLKETTAEDKMIPLMHVYMLSMEDTLTMSKLADLVAEGHSRIPVYEGERTNIRGLLLVKKLIVIDPNDSRRVDTLYLRMPVFVKPEITLLELLNEFQKGHSHMAIVTDQPDTMEANIKAEEPIDESVNVFGICTLEDIMEALIREDISDETDFAVSVKQALFTQQRKQRLTAFALKQKQQRKLALSGVAALVGAKSRTKTVNPTSYGAVRDAYSSGTMSPRFQRSQDDQDDDGAQDADVNGLSTASHSTPLLPKDN